MGNLAGWKRNLAAFVCGIMATLSLPPFFLVPLLIPAFTGLIWLINGATSRRRVFWDGWFWGWGFYMSGLYWFCIALLTDAEKFAWLIPFALFGLTGVIAIYSGIACLLLTYIRATGIARLYIFSVIWVLVEYARGHLFSGFPWNLAGYSFTASDISLQMASLLGIYGLTWLAVFLAMIPAALGDVYVERKSAWRIIMLAYGVLAAGLAWGGWRLNEAGDTKYVQGPRLRLVQANIAQHHKWEPEHQMEGLKEYALLTQSEGIENITHVVWPETAVPYVVREGSGLTQMLGAVLRPGAALITGALRSEGAGQDMQIWNSVVALDPDGRILGTYDKHKLVPFGEFLPFRSLIPEAWATPVGSKDFSRGAGPATVDWAGLPGISPLICYEAIFPALAVNNEARPGLLLNLTNDAWFGASSAPHQHMQMSRMRAVEQGIPLIRVANTGISMVADAHGRVVQQLGVNVKGVLDTEIPAANANPTLYGKVGDGILWILLIFIATVAMVYAKVPRNINIKN